MPTTGTRGISMLASNPECELLAAMVLERASEAKLYQTLAGQPLGGEYGERPSSLRRGLRFENRLYRNNGAMLKLCLSHWSKVAPDHMTIRNIATEVPGSASKLRARRLNITQHILRDAQQGKPVPDIIIQPQLALPPFSNTDTINSKRMVSPDYLSWDHQHRRYLVGEIKSFIVTNNRGDSLDVRRARLQAAVGILALGAEGHSDDVQIDEHDKRAILILGSPFGVEPTFPTVDNLEGEINAVKRAMSALAAVEVRLKQLKPNTNTPLGEVAAELSIHYEDACKPLCPMSSFCKARHRGSARSLGDEVSRILGPDASLAPIAELLRGRQPRDVFEASLIERFRTNLNVLEHDRITPPEVLL